MSSAVSSSLQGYLFRTCSWNDGGIVSTVSGKLLPDDNGVFLDQINADMLCNGTTTAATLTTTS